VWDFSSQNSNVKFQHRLDSGATDDQAVGWPTTSSEMPQRVAFDRGLAEHDHSSVDVDFGILQ